MAGIIGDTIDLKDYFTDDHDGENIRAASNWADEVKDFFHGGGKAQGATLPWSKTHDSVRLRRGEVSLWSGSNGMGKSMVTSHVALDLCAQGERVCIASMEMSPANTMARMSRQASGANQPSIETIDQFHQWTDNKLWIYDRRGSVAWERMVAVIRYARDHFGIDHFFIDSLAKCTKGETDYDIQKDFVSALCDVAKDCNLHVHLIHHNRKPSDANAIPDKFSAKGSGAITDLVDNVFGVWRNKQKEEMARHGNADGSAPDALLNLDKNRNGEFEGKILLWFDPASFQYRGDQEWRPKSYLRSLRVAA